MMHSDSLGALAKALAAAQAEIENATKNAANPHFRSNYADLAEIINTTRPVLTKHGLSLIQCPGFRDGVVELETMLLHESGEWIKSTAGAPIGKADAQGVGSAVTYLRRYSLAAVCNIAQEDDDGNGASQGGRQQGQPQRAAAKPAPKPPTKSAGQDGDGERKPWDRILPFGDKEGRPLHELEDTELRKLVEWCAKAKDPKKWEGLKADAQATLDHRTQGAARD